MNGRKKKAILEMAKRGTENEKRIALRLLEELGIEKKEDTPVNYTFRYTTKMEKRLLFQIYFMVTNQERIDYYQKPKGMKIVMLPMDYAEMNFHYEILRRDLKKEIEITYNAFIQRNHLFSSNSDIDEDYTLTPEDLKVIERAGTITPSEIRDGIEDKTYA